MRIWWFVVGLMVFSSCQTADNWDLEHHNRYVNINKPIAIHGHRGARSVRPENTLAAFREALRVGVDYIELDLGVTGDDAVVVYHDQKINPTLCLGPDGKPITEGPTIRSLTLEQLKTYDCGTLKNAAFPKQQQAPAERIPTLEEVFEMVKSSDEPAAKWVKFNIETKIDPRFPEYSPEPGAFAKLVYDLIKKHDLEDRVVVQSFDFRVLTAIKELDDDIKTSALAFEKTKDWVELAKELEVDTISPYFKTITEEEVRALNEEKITVVPWTVNEPTDWKMLVEWNVDGIITDDPEPLMKMLTEIGRSYREK